MHRYLDGTGDIRESDGFLHKADHTVNRASVFVIKDLSQTLFGRTTSQKIIQQQMCSGFRNEEKVFRAGSPGKVWSIAKVESSFSLPILLGAIHQLAQLQGPFIMTGGKVYGEGDWGGEEDLHQMIRYHSIVPDINNIGYVSHCYHTYIMLY